MSNTPNRIDPTASPNAGRTSVNLTVGRQTPKTDFGDRIHAGLDAAGSAVANGAAIAAPFVPGGAIVSAAVSSVSTMGSGLSSGQTASATPYAATGLVTLGQGAGTGAVNTTVNGGQPNITSSVGGNPNYLPQGTQGGSTVGQMNSELVSAQAENQKLLTLQIAMQRENQVFTTVSNVLKMRHDTVKNSIQNVR